MSELKHTNIIELIPAYALGSLDAADAALVERHLPACAVCREELAAYEAVTDMLPAAAPLTALPADLKSRLMQQVSPTSPQQTAVPPTWWQSLIENLRPTLSTRPWQPVLALAVVIILMGAIVFWRQTGTNSRIELTATTAAPDAQGIIEVAANGREATLTVTGLPALTTEQQYQLWLIRDGQRTSGAVFSVAADGTAHISVDSERPLSDYSAFGITIEPAGGSPGPTGKRVLGHNL